MRYSIRGVKANVCSISIAKKESCPNPRVSGFVEVIIFSTNNGHFVLRVVLFGVRIALRVPTSTQQGKRFGAHSYAKIDAALILQ